MGRKPVDKERLDDPELKNSWIKELSELYLKNGLTKFTMDEIAAKLGISKATLYKYFTSKEEILAEIVRFKILEIEAFEHYLMDDEMAFSERYFEVIKTASAMLAEVSIKFLVETKQKHPELWEKMRDFQDRALAAAEKFYTRGMEAGIIYPQNPKILALSDKMFIQAVSNPKFLEGHDISFKEALDGFFTMKSKGIFIKKDLDLG